MREWGILIGGIAVIAVLFDGWRRTRQSKSSNLPFDFPGDKEGGDAQQPDPLLNDDRLTQPDIFNTEMDFDAEPIGKTGDLDLGDISQPRPKGNSGSVAGFDDPAPSQSTPPPSPMVPPTPVSPSIAPSPMTPPTPPLASATSEEGIVSAPRPKVARESQPQPEKQAISNEVLTLFVRPNKGVLKGVELRNALVSMGLSYGERELYHRHSGSGREVLYSVANASSEGTFPEGSMEGFTSPGVIMLMELKGHPDPEHGFEEMVSSARQMSRRLRADVLDSHQQPLQVAFLSEAKALVKQVAKAQRTGASSLG